MISPEYVRMMADYNAWQNQSLYGAAAGLDQAARALDRGAFFGSIQATLSHVFWGDTLWMSRFDGWDTLPLSGMFIKDWATLKKARQTADTRIQDWAARVVPGDLSSELTWVSSSSKREFTRPRAMLIAHMFNHQTHHRGQVHAMLTAAGAKPDDTDIPFMPDL